MKKIVLRVFVDINMTLLVNKRKSVSFMEFVYKDE